MKNQYYLQNLVAHLTSLKQGGVAAGKALHKPVMLIALVDVLEYGNIEVTPEYIPIDGKLKNRFEEVWALLVPGLKPGNFFKPVFHLPNEGFWGVFTASNRPATKEYSSLKGVAEDGLWSRFHEDYAALIALPEVREIMRMIVLDTYFPKTEQRYWVNKGQAKLIAELQVEEPAPTYISKLEFVHFEGFVRHWKFRVNVLHVYDHTCCITGLRAQKGLLHPLVDACHIETHAKSGIDHPNNGLALCKNLHAAFDAGLISLSDDYRILVSNAVDFEESDTIYSLRRLSGQKILLPYNSDYHPKTLYLQKHRTRWDF